MSVYSIITERIISLLEEGEVPWKKSWDASTQYPRNFVSGKGYAGINVFMLASMRYSSPYWLTFNQVKDRGGQIKKGEKGMPVVFWSQKEVNDADPATGEAKIKKIPFMRYYTVFNAAQIEGIDFPEVAPRVNHNPIETAEKIILGYKDAPVIKHGFSRACYRPVNDEVNMPDMGAFISPEEYYSVAFHELGHSTGHEKRLNRLKNTGLSSFGDTEYSKEELVAEMTAAFLCAEAGIEQPILDNSAAYIKGWLKALKNDEKLLVQAAAQAQKAADWILGRQASEGAVKEEPVITKPAEKYLCFRCNKIEIPSHRKYCDRCLAIMRGTAPQQPSFIF